MPPASSHPSGSSFSYLSLLICKASRHNVPDPRFRRHENFSDPAPDSRCSQRGSSSICCISSPQTHKSSSIERHFATCPSRTICSIVFLIVPPPRVSRSFSFAFLTFSNVLFPRDFTNFIWQFFLPCRICPLIFLLFLCVHCFIF